MTESPVVALPLPADGGLSERALAQVEDRQLEEETIALFREINALRARAVGQIDEIDRRRTFEDERYLSAASWLRDKCRLTAKEAHGLVGAARALRSMPATRQCFADGGLTYPAVQMLGIARDAHPEVFGRDETMLVERAKVLSPRGLRQALDYWRQAADEDGGVSAAERRHRRRRLFISQTLDGMVRLDADLDPEGGAIVIAAIRAGSEPGALDSSDDRSAPQRRADALVELCRDDLDNGAASVSGGEKPHVLVLVDLQTLQGHRGSLSEFDDGTVIDAETARRLACDAGVSRVIVNGDSAPLDIGRKTRTVPAGLRRALVARDRGCTYPGCDRPPRWCEAHHIIPWAQDGPTALDNLQLLCRRHHRTMHPEHGRGGPDP